jgi:hypothetical protein
MPATIKMNINNLGYGRQFNQIYSQKQVNIAAVPSIPSVTSKNFGPLNSAMIGRIYTAKPGCGSCGK